MGVLSSPRGGTMTKKFYAYILAAVGVMLVGLSLGRGVPTTAASTPRLCNNNSIINCGALTAGELLQKYDANTTGDLDNIYNYYGISRSDIAGTTSNVKIGRVYKEGGRVTIGEDETVATDSYSAGRQNLSGSIPVVINGKTYYQRSDTRSYTSPYFDAFILMRNGQFYRAIMMSCGNPVKATPTPPKPTPQPGVTISKKVDAVDHKTVNIDQVFTYTLTVTNTGNVELKNVAVTDTPQAGITLVSSDQGTITNNTWSATIPSLALNATTSFAIKAKVSAYQAGDLKNTACVDAVETSTSPDACDSATVDVPAPKNVSVCNPATGEIITVKETEVDNYKPSTDKACAPMDVCVIASKTHRMIKGKDFDATTMSEDMSKCDTPQVLSVTTVANTGPGDVLVGTAGLGSVTAAGYYFANSRRKLISAIFKQ